MSTLKAKIGLTAIGAILMTATAVPAYAQVGVNDVDAHQYLQKIEEYTNDTQQDTDKIQDFHLDKTAKHYEAEIKRLDGLIKSLSYYTYSGDKTEKPQSAKDLYKRDADEKASREKISKIAEGTSTTFGFGTTAETGAGMDAYRDQYGILRADEVYDNDVMADRLRQLHIAGYIADATVGEANAGQEKRLQQYQDLEDRAIAADTAIAALEVNNALLLANGRNLATLINMETAALNAEAANLRSQAINQQAGAEAFGGNPLADMVLAGVTSAF